MMLAEEFLLGHIGGIGDDVFIVGTAVLVTLAVWTWAIVDAARITPWGSLRVSPGTR